MHSTLAALDNEGAYKVDMPRIGTALKINIDSGSRIGQVRLLKNVDLLITDCHCLERVLVPRIGFRRPASLPSRAERVGQLIHSKDSLSVEALDFLAANPT